MSYETTHSPGSLQLRLNKPHLLFRPSQVLRRARASRTKDPTITQTVSSVMGPITVHPAEHVGSGIARTGVRDLPVSEALVRLLDRGEVAIDAGANVGFMTVLLARRSGPTGTVYAFEPNPTVLPLLRENVARADPARSAPIVIDTAALSSTAGAAVLVAYDDFTQNQGTARVQPAGSLTAHSWEIVTKRADTVIAGTSVGVMKVDVEDHELDLFQGASESLERQRVRDIIFESHDPPPTAASRLLEAHGYSIFALDGLLLGPVLYEQNVHASRKSYDPPSYLATAQPARARRRLARRGWTVLNPRLFGLERP